MRVILTKTVKIAGRFRPPGSVVDLESDQTDLVPDHAIPVGLTEDGDAYDPETGEIVPDEIEITAAAQVVASPPVSPVKSRRRR